MVFKRSQIGLVLLVILGMICGVMQLVLDEGSSKSDEQMDLMLWQVLSSNGQSRLQLGYIYLTTDQLISVLKERTRDRVVVNVEKGVHFEDVQSALQLLRQHGMSEVLIRLEQEYTLPDEVLEGTNVPSRIYAEVGSSRKRRLKPALWASGSRLHISQTGR